MLFDRELVERRELIERIAQLIHSIETRADRVQSVWSLKIIAECVSQLDDIDRREGFLPIEIRPPLMLHQSEAAAALRILRKYKCPASTANVQKDTRAVLEKLTRYFSKDRI